MSEGYVFAIGECFGCHQPFTFDPDLVPSIHGEPICRECVDLANPEREKNGLPPIVVFPNTYPNE